MSDELGPALMPSPSPLWARCRASTTSKGFATNARQHRQGGGRESQGLCEYLEILPALQKGVFVHVHDIFTPRDYPPAWMQKGKVFWNEQYQVEAFLSFNGSFKVMGAINFLQHRHFAKLSAKCPTLSVDSEPGSFWMKKIK